LPEGATFHVGSTQFQITYTAGTGNDVVLTAVNRPPVVDDQSFSPDENQKVAGTVVATDPDLPDDSLDYAITSIIEWPDGGLFGIKSATGELSFLAGPDYETPLDADWPLTSALTSPTRASARSSSTSAPPVPRSTHATGPT
jgi:hypothetical protein